jgi:hypothetical protein
MQTDVGQIEKAVRRYWYEDGIAEVVGGGTFIILGMYFALQEYLGGDSLLTGILQASMVLLFIGGAIAARWLISTLKTRFTYARTGYVEYRQPRRSPQMRAAIAFGLGMVLAASAAILVRVFGSPDLIVAISGVLFGASLVATAGRTSGLVRFYVLGALSVALGVLLAFAGLPEGYALGLLYGLIGVAALASGAWTLRRYLHENPVAAEVGDGG